MLNVFSLHDFSFFSIRDIVALRSRLQRTLHAANAPCGIDAILLQSAIRKEKSIFQF